MKTICHCCAWESNCCPIRPQELPYADRYVLIDELLMIFRHGIAFLYMLLATGGFMSYDKPCHLLHPCYLHVSLRCHTGQKKRLQLLNRIGTLKVLGPMSTKPIKTLYSQR